MIIGAASGIGRGMAEAFAAAGMPVVLADIEPAALHNTTAQLCEKGADAPVHVLSNNAGVYTGSRPSWESTLNVHTVPECLNPSARPLGAYALGA
jgi:hypothetical protein